MHGRGGARQAEGDRQGDAKEVHTQPVRGPGDDRRVPPDKNLRAALPNRENRGLVGVRPHLPSKGLPVKTS